MQVGVKKTLQMKYTSSIFEDCSLGRNLEAMLQLNNLFVSETLL